MRLGELYLNGGVWHAQQMVPAPWVREAMAPSEAGPGHGLMWWLHTWNGHLVYSARGSEGQMIVVVPDQRSVTAIASANGQEFPVNREALDPLLNELIIPTIIQTDPGRPSPGAFVASGPGRLAVMTTGCPARKLEPDGVREAGPDVERVQDETGARWIVRSFAVARQILRAPDATQQAGFGAPNLNRSKMRPPILYQEGSQHRIQRRASARFFAPAVIENYQPMIARLSDALLSEVPADRGIDLSRLSMRLAVQVTGRVVGLTNSSVRGMSARLGTFFEGDPSARDRSPAGLLRTLRGSTALLGFYQLDVKPAIRARRRRPSEDVISQLLQQDFSDLEILTEALTYAAAGMATTREFVTVAAWHLLDEPDLRARYLAGERSEREAILHEILRLEPVVGELRRTTRESLTVQTTAGPVTIPVGESVELQLRRTNADADVVGEDPDGLCPGRALPPSVPPVVLSFGDGHHRCPGGPLAILESDIFLRRLLALKPVADGPPRVRWNPVSQGYDLDRFMVRLRN